MAPIAPTYQGTQTSWKKNPCNYKLSNHESLPHIVYNFLAVLKGGGKSIHISNEECLKELIMWLQEFVPPPTCFLAKWIVSMCRDNKYTSNCLIWVKHLDPMAYKHGQKYHRQKDFERHM
jgi:hypothetical protein